MPVEYKVYGCKFKCGKKHNRSKKAIEQHEKECFRNPENRTCLTCKHDYYYGGSSGNYEEPPEPRYRSCNIKPKEHYSYQ